MYTFSNVRFGKAPLGPLRFKASVYPDNVTTPEQSFEQTSGNQCVQGGYRLNFFVLGETCWRVTS